MKRLKCISVFALCITHASYTMYLTPARQAAYRARAAVQSPRRPTQTVQHTVTTPSSSIWQNIQQAASSRWQNMRQAVYSRLGWQTSREINMPPEQIHPVVSAVRADAGQSLWSRFMSYLYPRQNVVADVDTSPPSMFDDAYFITQEDLDTTSPIELVPLFKQFNKLQQIADNLRMLEAKAQENLLKLAKLPGSVYKSMINQIHVLKRYLRAHAQKEALEGVFRDPTVPFLKEIDDIARLAGLNPFSYSVGWNTSAEKDAFNHEAYVVKGYEVEHDSDANGVDVKPAAILFNKEVVEPMSPAPLNQTIIEAVTHITESHEEQLHLLQSALGKQQFDLLMGTKEGHIYRDAIDRNADLLLFTRVNAVAGNGREGIIAMLLNQVTVKQLIEQNPPILGPLYEHGIQCDLDYMDAPFFAEIAQFPFLETLMVDREKYIRSTFKKHVPDAVYQMVTAYEKEEKDYIDQYCYLTAHPKAKHNASLNRYRKLLDRAKNHLQSKGINPNSVLIDRGEMHDAYAQAPLLDRSLSLVGNTVSISVPQGFEPAQLLFGEDFLASIEKGLMPDHIIDWIIEHELVHLRRKHPSTMNALLFCLSTLQHVSKADKTWHFTFKNLNYILDPAEKQRLLRSKEVVALQKEQEMQADILPFLQNKNLAHAISSTLTPFAQTSASKIRPQEFYRSPYEIVLWLKAIQRCWEQEGTTIRMPLREE